MYYSVYLNTLPYLECALKALKIDYETKKNGNWRDGKWGTHKFKKIHEKKIKDYLKNNNINITFNGHSVYIA